MRNGTTLVAAVLLLAGCGTLRSRLVPDDNRVVESGVLAVWADWIVDKGEKFDVHLHFQNRSKKSILIFHHDLAGGRGETGGRVGFAAFGIGERTLDLKPEEVKSVILGCKTGPASGDFRITVKRVLENPSGDGKTPGDVVAEDVTWTLPEGAGK